MKIIDYFNDYWELELIKELGFGIELNKNKFKQ